MVDNMMNDLVNKSHSNEVTIFKSFNRWQLEKVH